MLKENVLKKFSPLIKKVWLSSPTMHGEELKYMQEAYETNWMSTVGENINAVEQLLCEKIGCKYAVALASGTAALHMAVKLAGVQNGDKVFCSDMTFAATVNPVVYEGGVPVFIDAEYATWNIDPAALSKAFELYPEVKVVVWPIFTVVPERWMNSKPFVINMAQLSSKTLPNHWARLIKVCRREILVTITLFLLTATKLSPVRLVECF